MGCGERREKRRGGRGGELLLEKEAITEKRKIGEKREWKREKNGESVR